MSPPEESSTTVRGRILLLFDNGGSMGQNAERFVDAYNAIDRHLRKITGADRGRSFSAVVRDAAESDAAVRRRSDDLLEYADLRNAIVHERQDGRVIAEPFQETAAAIERLRDLLTTPPAIGDRFMGAVHLVSVDDAVGEATAIMREGRFSQLPVYEGETFVGLLTVATIAWWVAHQLDEHGGVLEDRPVSEALAHTEDPEHHVAFAGRDATMFEAVSIFEDRQREGHLLDAVIITHSGSRDQKPLGILTVHDLPVLYDTIGG